MKLRSIEIDPAVVTELPEWTQDEIKRESEETLKGLGITRQENESYLLAWIRTMLAENGCEDNPENRKRLIEAIREDRDALLFVWVLGGDERKAFGLEGSPEFEMYRAEKEAERELIAALARAPADSDWKRRDREFDETWYGKLVIGSMSSALLSTLSLALLSACGWDLEWLWTSGWGGRIVVLTTAAGLSVLVFLSVGTCVFIVWVLTKGAIFFAKKYLGEFLTVGGRESERNDNREH